MTRLQIWILGAAPASLAVSLLALVQVRSAPPYPGLDGLRIRIESLEAQRSPPREPPALEPLQDRLAELSERLERLEARAQRVPLEAAAPRASATAESSSAGPGSKDPGAAPVGEAARREFESLLALFGPDFDFTGTPEQMQRFYELAKSGNLLGQSIADLEARIEADPSDLEGRMTLAGLYVAKLMTLPNGPEQGIWGTKAEKQWTAVVERDPDHWKANFSLGNNFAFYPDVLGKTTEAIHYLEEARRIQESAAPRDDEVRVYLALSRLHLRQGDEGRARAVLESGLRRHPSRAEMLRALEELDARGE